MEPASLQEALGEQPVAQHRHGYLRYEALLARARDARARGAGFPAAPGDAAARLGALAGGTPPPPADGGPRAFALAALLADVQRVRRYGGAAFDGLWARLLEAVAALRRAAEAGAGPGAGPLAPLVAALDALADDAVALDAFWRHNVAAAARLAAALDAPAGSAAAGAPAPELVAAAERAVVGAGRLDPLVLGLSDAWELLRLARADAAAAGAALAGGAPRARWVAPARFTRVTRKFWLLPRDVAAFKLAAARHLPVLVYGDRQKLTEVDPAALPLLAPPPTADAAAVASIYLDAPATLPRYHERLRRADGATAFRLRWYGGAPGGPPPADAAAPLFLERKVHREAFAGEYSAKERAPLPAPRAAAFLAGADGARALSAAASADGRLLREAQAAIAAEGLRPLLRTSYARTAFQSDADNLVRLSLDTELAMTAEAGGPPPRGGAWARDLAAAPPGPAEVEHFPYAVVEVKLQAKPPPWLKELVTSGLLLAAPKFSKFLHGTAALYQERCEAVPHWWLPDEGDAARMTPATWEEMADPSDAYMKDVAQWLFPSSDAAPPPPPPPPARRRGGALGALLRGRGGGAVAPATPAPAAEAGAVPAAWPVYQAPPVSPKGGGGGGSSAGSGADVLAGASPTDSAATSHAGGAAGAGSCSDSSSEGRRAGGGGARAARAAAAADLEAGAAAAFAAPAPLLAFPPPAPLGARAYAVARYASAPAAPPPPGGDKDAAAGGAGASVARRASAIVRTRVEPKTFFANERTFLQWLQISVLIMFLATSLLGGAGSPLGASGAAASSSSACPAGDKACQAARLSGAIIAPVALLFMAYALFMYRKRTAQILRRETVRYDDQRGPVALVAILLAVMLISYVMTLVYFS